ncbi:MAG: acyl-CoA dehydrogenase N-terminal domain-containing protein, partial [Chromatocurvus sp.]
MSNYHAPLDDMSFLVDEVLAAGDTLGQLPRFAELDAGPDLTAAVLGEGAKFAADVLAPLRRVGDQNPATCADGAVTLPPGYGEALSRLA